MDQKLYTVLPFPLCFLCEVMKEKVTECFQVCDLCEGGEARRRKRAKPKQVHLSSGLPTLHLKKHRSEILHFVRRY